ncbi:ABC transporter permease [Nonomuraea rubra]|uniref:ABC-type dipeptide/oligopeptide/nickel transport system permease component n=1 Tax=Nonomuraea rubra TaxID=46180 RepID=A0A7X0P1A3_9ACTN|nr:ABC transporter permease [Nonomuraea rubra]MBB6553249.1 ABC-type dipeptide/oligopeptide/nickel transport system permease component [Nonomuraea rubra]
MLLIALRRAGQAVMSALGGGVIVFALLIAAPGDPARRILNVRGIEEPDPAQVAAVRAELGLEQPIPIRFLDWFAGLFRGDLGVSWRTGNPVASEFASRLPATIILTVAALLIAVALALMLGILAGWRRGGWADHLSRGLSTVALALPAYLIGVLLLDLVAVRLGWGRVIADGTWATVFLPAFTLALASAAVWSRVLRAALLDLDAAGFLRISTARGASTWRNMFVHRLPNALPPFLTVVGLGAATLVGGAPIAETVFSWPGVGKYTIEAITARDMPVLTAFTMIAVLAYVGMSLVVDLLIVIIDPRQAVRT